MTPSVLGARRFGYFVRALHENGPGIVATRRGIGGTPIEFCRMNRPGLRLCAGYDAGVTETASDSTKEIWTMSPSCS